MKTMPIEHPEYHPQSIRYEFVNTGSDAEAGQWGTVDGLYPEHVASEHSSFVSESMETVLELYRKDNPKDEHFMRFSWHMMNTKEMFHTKDNSIYNSEGIVVFTGKDVYEMYEHYSRGIEQI
jgi:hypothetical protein